MTRDVPEIHETSGNIFADLGLPDAGSFSEGADRGGALSPYG